jgi:hypothetical protein
MRLYEAIDIWPDYWPSRPGARSDPPKHRQSRYGPLSVGRKQTSVISSVTSAFDQKPTFARQQHLLLRYPTRLAEEGLLGALADSHSSPVQVGDSTSFSVRCFLFPIFEYNFLCDKRVKASSRIYRYWIYADCVDSSACILLNSKLYRRRKTFCF